MNYCLYHANCPDGFASALVVWQKYGDDFKYIPVQYGQPLPEVLSNDIDNGSDINDPIPIDKLYIVDFSYSEDILQSLEKKCNEIVVIDHHDRSKNLANCKFEKAVIVFREDHSGATLVYRYFNGYDEDIPEFFRYIEDRDLWKWELPNSREFSAGLDLEEMDFKSWNLFAINYTNQQFIITNGASILKYVNKKVESLGRKAVVITNDDDHKVATINSCLFQSELGEWLNNNLDIDYADIFFIQYSEEGKGQIIHSLRSKGQFNVTEFAKIKGGGGHPSGRAAGYTEDL